MTLQWKTFYLQWQWHEVCRCHLAEWYSVNNWHHLILNGSLCKNWEPVDVSGARCAQVETRDRTVTTPPRQSGLGYLGWTLQPDSDYQLQSITYSWAIRESHQELCWTSQTCKVQISFKFLQSCLIFSGPRHSNRSRRDSRSRLRVSPFTSHICVNYKHRGMSPMSPSLVTEARWRVRAP